ncbi:unnamed protein product [Nezara viridula]|uniref:Uncharacterized protein n=1 Tax=Nezara viridula TaxID=85310 RepID=A0A9P0H391_NEZVI|nr:unnamed protein product [Nezara viridula]
MWRSGVRLHHCQLCQFYCSLLLHLFFIPRSLNTLRLGKPHRTI